MRKLGVHVGLYTLLLVAVLSLIPLDSSFGSDDGAYGAQVYALRQGGWTLPRPLPVVEQDNEGWLNSAITPDGPTPYTANPAYALLLHGVVTMVEGSAESGAPAQEPATGRFAVDDAGSLALGLHVVPALGAVLSAVVAWLLAAQWSRRAAPLAFWLLALGPVLVNATTLWAHTLSTALGGLALYLLVRVSGQGPNVRPGGLWVTVAGHSGIAVLLVACALVRTEAVLWIVALTATALAVTRSTRSLALAAGAGVSGAVAVVSWLISRGWGQSLRADRLPVETSVVSLSEPPGWLVSRIPAAWQLLLSSLTGGPGPVLTLAALGAGVLGALRIRRADDDRCVRVGSMFLVGAAGFYAARIVLAPDVAISGTLGAWPLLLLLPLAARPDGTTGARSESAATAEVVSVTDAPENPTGTRPESAATAEVVSGADTPENPTGARPESAATANQAASGGGGMRRSVAVGGAVSGDRGLMMLMGPSALLVLAVVATQYAGSGGLQWGGRYLSFAFAPMAAAAAVRGQRVFEQVRPLAALAVLPAIAGIVVSYRLHHTHHAVTEATRRPEAEVVITEFAAVPRIAWPALPTAYYRADDANVESLLVQLGAAGVDTVNVHGLATVHLDGLGGYRQVEEGDGLRHLVLEGPGDREDPSTGQGLSGRATPSPGALAADP